jgi:hypothetical protein
MRADEEMLFCHRGKTHAPPERLRIGDTLTDDAQRVWAYTGDSGDERGGAIFNRHQERTDLLPACEPLPPPVPAPTTKGGEECQMTVYPYQEDLRAVRYDFPGDKKKEFQPQFFFNGRWNAGDGSKIWPFYGSLDSASSGFVIEVEGEKCVDVLRQQGIAAITHPGHQRNEASCRARYASLLTANVKKVYFISDNDAPGRKKAAGFFAAAQLAGIDLRIIPAESICEVPDGGSVDDMPAEQLGSLIAAAMKSASGAKPAPLSRVSYGRIKQALQEFHNNGSESAADIKTAIADIASAHDASPFDVSRIWDALDEDRRVEAEALSSRLAIGKRQELEVRRRAINLADYLPENICGAIEDLTGNLPCDPITSVAVVLTTAAGCVRAGHRVDAGDGLFVKEPVIWTLLSGLSGNGKSPIMRILSKERLRLVLAHYDQISTSEEHEYEMRYGSLPKAKRPEKPEALRTCIDDFTTESLNGILGDNHRNGLATFIYSEEIKSVLGNFDEYKTTGKGRGKETFLCLFDGNVSSQHRVGRRSKPIHGKVQNALLGGVQPGVFRRMMEGGDDAGLFARCLVLPITNEYVEPNFFRTPEEIQTVHVAGQCLEEFYLRCLGIPPLVLRLEREAVELFTLLSRDTWEKAQSVALESQRAVLGKRLGYILQIALTIHLCAVAGGEEKEDELYLSKRTLARAVVLVDLLQSYAIVEQQESQMQRHGTFELTRRIHVYAMGTGSVTATEFLSRCIPSRFRRDITSAHIKAAMDQLVAAGLGEWREKRFIALGKYPD